MRKMILKWLSIISLVTFFCLQYLFIGEILRFSESISPLVYELFAAVIGSIITIAAMGLMMKAQQKHDTEVQYSAQVFEKKLTMYQDLLSIIFSIDDDNIMDKNEIQKVENQIGIVCLVADRDLVSLLAQFMYQLKVYGVLYFRSMNQKQLTSFQAFIKEEKTKPQHLSKLANEKYYLQEKIDGNELAYFISLDDCIQGLRYDIAVVSGDVSHDIEHFVRTPINPSGLISSPNRI